MDVTEWTQVIVWIALVLVLGVVEVFTLDFVFIMLAAGAAGGLVAALLGAEWWLSTLIAAVLALLLLAVVRPRVLRALNRGADPHRTGIDGLVGMSGTVALAFTSSGPGQVRLANGETWSARFAPGTTDRTPPLGTRVVVESIEGSTAVVRTEQKAGQ
ncbi:NfeD family protein [Curtobacterium sp. MCPF17_050]|uniref:NfeD family protein n=1 Tax=unclassified Curtobacterium TaxID=257496 RepID=UPI0015E8D89D|nr:MULTISPECIES: NfeD family protein [unclassified Curtobacterium]WIB14155.1 NfeD family protein [Curtobacterium sp. MCPF17_050]